MVVTSSDLLEEAIVSEVERRRNFAIISQYGSVKLKTS